MNFAVLPSYDNPVVFIPGPIPQTWFIYLDMPTLLPELHSQQGFSDTTHTHLSFFFLDTVS